MTASGSVINGEVLNKAEVTDKKTVDVKASTTLGIGLVYQDGTNGWTNVPTTGAVKGRQCYWNPKSVNNSSGAKGAKTAVVYGTGAKVVGTADGAIVVDQRCKPSTNVAQAFESHAVPTVADEGDTSTVDLGGEIAAATQAVYTFFDDVVAIYRGHVGETVENGNDPTNAGDTETDVIFEIVRN